MKTKNIFAALLALLAGFTACKKDDAKDPLENALETSFVPSPNHKYHYTITLEDGTTGQAVKSITGSKDSAGLKVFNLRTLVSSDAGQTTLNNHIFTAAGKTVTEMVMPDIWNDVIEMFGSLPDIEMIEATPLGFPVYEVLDNLIATTSKLTFKGPATQGQYLKFLQRNEEEVNTFEVMQSLVHNPGQVVAVETITVPAGTFVCSKIQFSMDNTQVVEMNGAEMGRQEFREDITVWMAHGIGIVKSINVTEIGTSTTILRNIE